MTNLKHSHDIIKGLPESEDSKIKGTVGNANVKMNSLGVMEQETAYVLNPSSASDVGGNKDNPYIIGVTDPTTLIQVNHENISGHVFMLVTADTPDGRYKVVNINEPNFGGDFVAADTAGDYGDWVDIYYNSVNNLTDFNNYDGFLTPTEYAKYFEFDVFTATDNNGDPRKTYLIVSKDISYEQREFLGGYDSEDGYVKRYTMNNQQYSTVNVISSQQPATEYYFPNATDNSANNVWIRAIYATEATNALKITTNSSYFTYSLAGYDQSDSFLYGFSSLGGQLGIGTTPDAADGIRIDNGAGSTNAINVFDGETSYFRVLSGGKVLINNTSDNNALEVFQNTNNNALRFKGVGVTTSDFTRWTTSSITSGNAFQLEQDTSAWSGNIFNIQTNIGSLEGASFTGDLINFENGGSVNFGVDDKGNTGIATSVNNQNTLTLVTNTENINGIYVTATLGNGGATNGCNVEIGANYVNAYRAQVANTGDYLYRGYYFDGEATTEKFYAKGDGDGYFAGNLVLGALVPAEGKLHIEGSSDDPTVFISQDTGGAVGIAIDFPSSSGRPLALYDDGTFVGGIDYNFGQNYFSFDVTNALGTRIRDAFTIASETDDNFIGMGTTTPGARLHVQTTNTTDVGQIIQGVASQSANLQEWKDSTGTNLAWVDSTGRYQATLGSGAGNLFMGSGAGRSASTGTQNIALGVDTMNALTTGVYNVALGSDALGKLTTGSWNIALGQFALNDNLAGSLNVAIGYRALYYSDTSNSNVAIGYDAGYGSPASANSENVLIGRSAGRLLTSGSYNTFLGSRVGDNTTTGNYNIGIGYNIDMPSATTDGQLSIGNLIFGTGIDGTGTTISSGNIGIKKTSPDSTLDVSGSLGLKIQRNTTNTTIDDTAYQWNGDTDGGGFTYTLPAGVQDRQYKIVNTGTSGNLLTITPNGAENLLGVNSSFVLYDGESLIIGYDTTDGWY